MLDVHVPCPLPPDPCSSLCLCASVAPPVFPIPYSALRIPIVADSGEAVPAEKIGGEVLAGGAGEVGADVLADEVGLDVD